MDTCNVGRKTSSAVWNSLSETRRTVVSIAFLRAVSITTPRVIPGRQATAVVGASPAVVALVVGLAFSSLMAIEEAAQRRTAEFASYRATLIAASLEIDSGAHGEGIQALETVPESMRGWEWEHLRSRVARHLWEAAAHEDADAGHNRYRFFGVPGATCDPSSQPVLAVSTF